MNSVNQVLPLGCQGLAEKGEIGPASLGILEWLAADWGRHLGTPMNLAQNNSWGQ